MDKKSEFDSVMQGNSYLQLQKIVDDREGWVPEAVLAAEKELKIRDHMISNALASTLSDFSDNEIKLILSNSEKYPDQFIEQVANEKAKRDATTATEKNTASEKTQLEASNENIRQKVRHTEKKNAEIPSTMNQINKKYKVVPFNPSNNVPDKLQSIIDSESGYGWRYINHQYSDKLKPGSSGCFGIGATPTQTIHIGFVIFEKS